VPRPNPETTSSSAPICRASAHDRGAQVRPLARRRIEPGAMVRHHDLDPFADHAGADVVTDIGVTTRSVQNRTVRQKANKINDLPNRLLAHHDHSWRQIAGIFRSKPSLAARPKCRVDQQTPSACNFEQIVW
jgi:hypothetical protein